MINDEGAAASWLETLLDMRKSRVSAIRKIQELRNSFVFVLWSLDELRREDFFTLADMLETENPSKDIDLFVLSPGGSGEAGYRIGHSFQQWCRRQELGFRVVIPLYAKSAATILALGASELVMGLHSEIGPIDPQIPKYDESRMQWRYIPAMAIIDGLKLISEYINKIPHMSSFFEEIVKAEKLGLDDLGVLERSRESGKQYGETLLAGCMLEDAAVARASVERLADYYKYHGHPIDAYEAEEELKLSIHHASGKEWELIKAVRDEFQDLVGRVGLIPGALVTSAIETVNLRSWRYTALQKGQGDFVYVKEGLSEPPTK